MHCPLLVSHHSANPAVSLAASLKTPSANQARTIPRIGSMIMGNYFKPWRREFGVVTLLLACLFAAGWVRSISDPYVLAYAISSDSHVLICSASQVLNIGTLRENDVGLARPRLSRFSVLSKPDSGSSFVAEDSCGIILYEINHQGFESRTSIEADDLKNLKNFKFSTIQVPYTSIVIPLTLLSAWLLLSKPQAKPQ